MKNLYKKVIALIMWVFSSGMGLFIMLQLTNVIDYRMLKSGYLEGAGTMQFFKVLTGGPALIILAIAWLALVIFSFEFYFSNGVENNNLIKNFALVTAIEMFLLPVIIVIYQLAFPLKMYTVDWIIVAIGLLFGFLGIYIYKRK